MFFLFSSRVFLIVATLAIVWFLQYKSYFFIFRVFSFFRQKSRKIDVKTRSQKIIKKWQSGHPFWDPKSMKIDAGSPEKRLNCEKTSFLEDTVFWSFFRCVFSWILRPLGIPGGLPKSTFPPLFSTFWRACRFRAAPGVSWDLFGSIFHRFSVDFGTIFARFLLVFFVDLLSICCPSWADFGCFFFLVARARFPNAFLTALVKKNSD